MTKGVIDKMKLNRKKFKCHRNPARWTCTYINDMPLQLTNRIVTSYLKHQITDKKMIIMSCNRHCKYLPLICYLTTKTSLWSLLSITNPWVYYILLMNKQITNACNSFLQHIAIPFWVTTISRCSRCFTRFTILARNHVQTAQTSFWSFNRQFFFSLRWFTIRFQVSRSVHLKLNTNLAVTGFPRNDITYSISSI